MKGMAGPMISIIVILAIGIAVLFWLRGTTNIEKSIVERSVGFISSINRGQTIVKNLNEGIGLISQKTADENGKAGGGFSSWTKDSPTDDELAKALAEQIKNKIDSYGFSFSVENNTASGLKAEEIYVSDYNKEPCGNQTNNFNSTCFRITGKYYFSFKNNALDAKFNIEGALDKNIGSSYFGMAAVGRKFLEEYNYISFLDSGYSGIPGLKDLKTKGSASKSCGGCTSSSFDREKFSETSCSCSSCKCDDLGTLEKEALDTTDYKIIESRLTQIMKKIEQDLEKRYPYVIFSSKIEDIAVNKQYSYAQADWQKSDSSGSDSCTSSTCSETDDEGYCQKWSYSLQTATKCTRSATIAFSFTVNAEFKFKQYDKNSLVPQETSKSISVPMADGSRKDMNLPFDYLNFTVPFKYSAKVKDNKVER